MKLVEIIDHLKNLKEAEKFVESQLPNVDFGQIDVYLKGKLDINSEVFFFDAEAIENNLEIEINGEKYVNLFPLYMTQEMIEEYKNKTFEKLTDVEIAKKLLEYRDKDA